MLEAARRQAIFDEVFVYEPGVPVRGQLRADWLDDYQHRLEHGDRRGAFARMVKGAGFAPKAAEIMPVSYLRFVLRIAIQGEKSAKPSTELLEENLVEHRLQAALRHTSAERFSTITSRTVLLGGANSPDSISGPLLDEIAAAIPSFQVAILPDSGTSPHINAPTESPRPSPPTDPSNRAPHDTNPIRAPDLDPAPLVLCPAMTA